MFLNKLDLVKDMNILEELEKEEIRRLVFLKIEEIFINGNDYQKENLDEVTDTLIEYITFILVAYSNYSFKYVRKMTEIELLKNLKNRENFENLNLSIWDFIDVASKSNENDLNLDRLDIENATIHLNYVQTSLYYKHQARNQLKNNVERIKDKKTPDVLKKYIDEINEFLMIKEMFSLHTDRVDIQSVHYKGDIPQEWFPPCIRGILSDILSGGSPSHYPRRSLVAFLFAAKFDPNLRMFMDGKIKNIKAKDVAADREIEGFLNEIIGIFNTSADFDVEKTKYYISNNIGYNSQRYVHCEYCKNWNDNGLGFYCHKDELCERNWIKHPLDYLCFKIKSAQRDKTLKSDCLYLNKSLETCRHTFNSGYGCMGKECSHYTAPGSAKVQFRK